MERGAGFMAIHYGVEVNKGEQGEAYLKWMGGYFETVLVGQPYWTPKFKEIPEHETTRGVKPFAVNDEWYYHMRFVDGHEGRDADPRRPCPELKTVRRRRQEVQLARRQPVRLRSRRRRQAAAHGLGLRASRRRPRLRLHRLSQATTTWRTTASAPCCSTPSPGPPSSRSPTTGVPSRTPTQEDLDNLIKETLRVGE